MKAFSYIFNLAKYLFHSLSGEETEKSNFLKAAESLSQDEENNQEKIRLDTMESVAEATETSLSRLF